MDYTTQPCTTYSISYAIVFRRFVFNDELASISECPTRHVTAQAVIHLLLSPTFSYIVRIVDDLQSRKVRFRSHNRIFGTAISP